MSRTKRIKLKRQIEAERREIQKQRRALKAWRDDMTREVRGTFPGGHDGPFDLDPFAKGD